MQKNRSGMVWDDVELSWTTSNIVMKACKNPLASKCRRLSNNLFNHLTAGPPTGAPISKRLRRNLGLTIGCIDMQTMHVGSLADKNKRVRNEHAIRSDRE